MENELVITSENKEGEGGRGEGEEQWSDTVITLKLR